MDDELSKWRITNKNFEIRSTKQTEENPKSEARISKQNKKIQMFKYLKI